MTTGASSSLCTRLAEDCGPRLLGLIAGLYAVGAFSLMLGIDLSASTAITGLLVGLVVTHLVSVHQSWAGLLVTLGLLGVALFAASLFFDGSSDAIGYHKPGVLQLLDGWNPYRNVSVQSGLSYWTVVYPKASWICGAQLTQLTGRLECAKAINLLGLLASAISAWRFLRTRLVAHPRIAVATAILIGFNPVTVAQCMTFYVDGLIASLLTILFFALADLVTGKRSRLIWFELAVCTLLLANLKFTGLVYAGIAWLIAGAFIWRSHGRNAMHRPAWVCALVFTAAVLLFGKTPYLDNLTAGRHLFHPLLGSEKIDLLKDFRPARLVDHDRFTRFAIANFFQDARDNGNPSPKWPFQFQAFAPHSQDAQIAGFGPFYGETLGLAALALIALWVTRRPLAGTVGAFLFSAVVVTSFCHEDAWWARYSPQMFLLVPLAITVLARSGDGTSAWASRLAVGLILILSANLAIVGFNSMGRRAWITHRLNQDIASMSAASTQAHPIEIDFGHIHPLERTLREKGIPFIETPGAATSRWIPVYSTGTCFWRPSPAR